LGHFYIPVCHNRHYPWLPLPSSLKAEYVWWDLREAFWTLVNLLNCVIGVNNPVFI
jgi:hypothetical protein